MIFLTFMLIAANALIIFGGMIVFCTLYLKYIGDEGYFPVCIFIALLWIGAVIQWDVWLFNI